MTVDPDRFIKNPPAAEGKREPSHELEKAGSAKAHRHEEELIEKGPFKGLPLPLQKKERTGLLPYIACNEIGQETTLGALASNASQVPSERRVHLGFSVWFNFDVMAITNPSYGIVCDFDNKTMDIYGGIGEALAKSSNRQEFVHHFAEFLTLNAQQLFDLPASELPKFFDIRRELTRQGSWLATDASFQILKNLYQKGHLLFLNLDITDKDSFLKIHKWLNGNNLELDTLYTSNIIDWLKDALQQQTYILNLKTVSSPHTRFIQAYAPGFKRVKGAKPTHEPTQYITKGVNSIELPPSLKE